MLQKIDTLNQKKIRAWRLPLYQPYKNKLNSQNANLCNASLDGMAGSITAALFIEDFIENKKHLGYTSILTLGHQVQF